MNRLLTIPEPHVPAIVRALEIRLHVLAGYRQLLEAKNDAKGMREVEEQRKACGELMWKLKNRRQG